MEGIQQVLITPEYRALNVELHNTAPRYGTSGHKWAEHVATLAAIVGAASILDYGCGKQTLAASLQGVDVRGYDPAIPGLDKLPDPADLVVCTDVLEHVERECIDDVLDHIRSLTRKAALINVSCRVGGRQLPDGRPAHILVRPVDWWAKRMAPFIRLDAGPDEFACLIGPCA